jgi:histidyl-tRNA synthetase
MGDVTFADFLETHGLTPNEDTKEPELYVGTPNASDISSAQGFADTLRAQGARVFVNLTERALGDQVKDAVKRGIPYFAAYGAQEVSSAQCASRRLQQAKKQLFPLLNYFPASCLLPPAPSLYACYHL